MILTDDEMRQVRQCLEDQAGLDPELVLRCGDLLRLGKFDEAVRSAFVLLEEQLRESTKGTEGMTGTQLADHVFSPKRKGSLAHILSRTPSEQQGLREIYSGAFKLFRNPTAHGIVGYDAAEGKAIVGLVNLLLGILAKEPPPRGFFPENVEAALEKAMDVLGAGAAGRLRVFLGQCIQIGLKPKAAAKITLPFKGMALIQYGHWDKSKPYRLTIFYLKIQEDKQELLFPVHHYYKNVIDLEREPIIQELEGLSFRPAGKSRHHTIDLRFHNDEAFFEALLDLIERTVEDLEETLQ